MTLGTCRPFDRC